MPDELRRPATLADCAGCVNDRFNGPDRRCWSFVHARIVPKWRVPTTAGNAYPLAVMTPQCYSEPGYVHVSELPGQSRSQWEGGEP